jgi:hypothetical protein
MAATSPAATVTLTPVVVISRLTAGSASALPAIAVSSTARQIFAKSIKFAQVVLNREALVVRKGLPREPRSADATKQIRGRTLRDQIGMQGQMHLVLNPCSMPDNLIAAGNKPSNPLGCRIGRPDLRQVSGRKKA